MTSRRAGGLASSRWLEPAGYAAVGVGLLALMLWHVRQVDGFYLDEWLYTQGGRYMWEHLPLGPLQEIPGWTRGPQRLYTILLAGLWGPFAPPTAFALSHVLNAVLLASSVVPVALLARRVVQARALRIVAVGLAVGVPWLVISANLLTENLAFPVFLWCVYAIVRTAEDPSPIRQIAALLAVGAVTLCRLNLAVMFGVLLVAVVVGEVVRRPGRSAEPLGEWLRVAARRQALLICAFVALAAGGFWLVASGGKTLGAYGAVTDTSILDAVWGSEADDSARAMLTYLRSIAAGSFVFPLVIGIAAALGGARGRLGPSVTIPAVVALASLVGVIVAISIWNVAFGTLEERYGFYVYAPLAVLAVAGVERLDRLRLELVAAGAIVVCALAVGIKLPSANSGNFFASPGGAFWTRVVEHRLVRADERLLGWVPIGPNGWLLVAVAIGALLIVVSAARGRRSLLVPVFGVGLGLCFVSQLAVLDYDFKLLLNGTPEAPGGLAASENRSADRDDWIDEALPEGASAAMVPAVVTWTRPYGDAERQQFWSRSLDGVVALRFANAPAPSPPGVRAVESELRDGLAGWEGPRFGWLVAQRDDPRVQFPGRLVTRSRFTDLALWRVTTPTQAVWTSAGLESDGSVLQRTTVTMTLARSRLPHVRSIGLRLRGPDGAPGPTDWRIHRAGRLVAVGRVAAAHELTIRLAVPPCRPGRACPPAVWTLTTSGQGAAMPLPAYGPTLPPRQVMLQVLAAKLEAT